MPRDFAGGVGTLPRVYLRSERSSGRYSSASSMWTNFGARWSSSDVSNSPPCSNLGFDSSTSATSIGYRS